MNKKQIFVYILLCITILISACSAGKAPDAANEMNSDFALSNQKSDTLAESEQTEVTEQKKIIKNADVFIESGNADESYNKLYTNMTKLGGYEFSRSTNKSSNRVSIDLLLKIPSQNLDSFLASLHECGEIISSNVSADDITDKYLDLEIRMDNMRKSLEKYYDFLSNSKNIDEMLKVQNEINRLTADIESAEGRINLWNKQVAESDVNIRIREKSDPARYSGMVKWNSLSFKDMGNLMKVGFISVSNTIVSVFQWLLVIVVSIFPVIIIAAGVVWFIIYKKRKAPKKNNKEIEK